MAHRRTQLALSLLVVLVVVVTWVPNAPVPFGGSVARAAAYREVLAAG